LFPSLPVLPSPPFNSLSLISSPLLFPPLSYLNIPFPILPLEVGPLNPAREVWGSAVSGVWGRVPAFVYFSFKI